MRDVVGGIVDFLGLRRYLRWRRSPAVKAFAEAHGLTYSPRGGMSLGGDQIGMFMHGIRNGFENVFIGTWKGLPVKAADYWYYTESTNSQGETTGSYTYRSVALTDLTCSVPHVSIAREDLVTRLIDRGGFHDIDFESEQFNRAFKVGSQDRAFAFKLINARMMAFLPRMSGPFAIDVVRSTVLVHSRLLRPKELPSLLDAVKGVRDHIPRLVWTEYGSGPPADLPPAGDTEAAAETSSPKPLPPPPPMGSVPPSL